jgi:hypothetical protein
MFPPRPCPPKSLLHVEDDVLWGRAVKQMVNGRREVSHIGTAATAAQGLPSAAPASRTSRCWPWNCPTLTDSTSP